MQESYHKEGLTVEKGETFKESRALDEVQKYQKHVARAKQASFEKLAHISTKEF